jgi:hypothetical protein
MKTAIHALLHTHRSFLWKQEASIANSQERALHEGCWIHIFYNPRIVLFFLQIVHSFLSIDTIIAMRWNVVLPKLDLGPCFIDLPLNATNFQPHLKDKNNECPKRAFYQLCKQSYIAGLASNPIVCQQIPIWIAVHGTATRHVLATSHFTHTSSSPRPFSLHVKFYTETYHGEVTSTETRGIESLREAILHAEIGREAT